MIAPQPLSPDPSVPSSLAAVPGERASLLVSILTVVGIVLFVDVEIVAAAAAAVWAIAGLLHLPLAATMVLAVLIGLPAAWACWVVARKAWNAEMHPDPEV